MERSCTLMRRDLSVKSRLSLNLSDLLMVLPAGSFSSTLYLEQLRECIARIKSSSANPTRSFSSGYDSSSSAAYPLCHTHAKQRTSPSVNVSQYVMLFLSKSLLMTAPGKVRISMHKSSLARMASANLSVKNFLTPI